jgi:hypothetical protein
LLSDPNRRFHLTLLGDFLAANEREEVPATALLLQLSRFYPDLNLDVVAGDAGFGFDVFLRTIYSLGAKRIVDLRAHDTDKNKKVWPLRGYDDRGRPICPFGYALTANGFDANRQRYKWFCAKACLQEDAEPFVELDNVSYPPAECGYQHADHPYGRIFNLGNALPMAPFVWPATCLSAPRPGNVFTIEPEMLQKLAMPLSSTGDSNACLSTVAYEAKHSPSWPIPGRP